MHPRSIVAFFSFLLLSGTVHGETIHVPADTATIQEAIDVSRDGDTVAVEAGTYMEGIGFNGKRITLISTEGAGSTIIDGGSTETTVTFAGPENRQTILQGFTITNSRAFGIHLKGRCSPRILDCIVTENNVAGISGSHNADGLEITQTWIHSNNGPGLTFFNCTPLIEACRIENNSQGVHQYNSPSVLSNCLVIDNNGAGLSLRADLNGWGFETKVLNTDIVANGVAFTFTEGEFLVLTNSIVYGNLEPTIQVRGLFSQVLVSHCLVEEGQESFALSGDAIGISWESGNIDADPLFADQADGDYQLSVQSPCVSAGIETDDTPSVDIKGILRLNPPTIGA